MVVPRYLSFDIFYNDLLRQKLQKCVISPYASSALRYENTNVSHRSKVSV